MAKSIHVKLLTVLLLTILFPLATLGVREANASTSLLKHHTPILIDGPSAFTSGNGVTGGAGTQNNPYLIEGWSIDASNANGVEIRNVVSEDPVYFVVRNVFIHSETNLYADILVDSYGSFPGCFECPGVLLPGVIANSTLTDNANGIVVENSNNIIVTGVIIHDTQTGVNCLNSAFSEFRTNTITDTSTGINLDCSVTDAFYNTILNSDNGIVVGNFATIDVEHNLVTSPRGFTLLGSGTMTIISNSIIGETGPTIKVYQYGISLNGADDIAIQNNTITNTGPTNQTGPAGVSIDNSFSILISGNAISVGNATGIALYSAQGVQVYHNNFLNNTVHAFDQTGQNTWDNGYPSGGNYWSGYTGVDNCSGPQQNICPSPDGIGDTPYVFNYNRDNYPLMRPFA